MNNGERKYKDFLKSVKEQNPKHHYIFYNWYLDIRAGGPTGYLANLLRGLNNLPAQEDDPGIWFAVDEKTPEQPKSVRQSYYLSFINWLRKSRRFNQLYVNHLSRSYRIRYDNLIRFLSNILNERPNKSIFSQIDLKQAKTIHVHTVDEVVKIKNELSVRNRPDIKVILTCHVPESVALEYYHNALDEGLDEDKATAVLQGWARAEREGYRQADILIYPSYESMEPAKHFVPDFEDLIKGKDIRFVATGANAIKPKLEKEEAKKKYNVQGKTVIGYLGRHNSIKGYDILKRAASTLLSKRQDMVFLIGGLQGGEFAPLKHSRWIECGRVDPAEFLPAVDIFVLPNRATYYDLVLLEVMSMGIPIVASHTGGNISVQKVAPALRTYEGEEEGIIEAVEMLSSMSKAELETIGQELKESYQSYFTVQHFAQRYIDTIKEIYVDYGL